MNDSFRISVRIQKCESRGSLTTVYMIPDSSYIYVFRLVLTGDASPYFTERRLSSSSPKMSELWKKFAAAKIITEQSKGSDDFIPTTEDANAKRNKQRMSTERKARAQRFQRRRAIWRQDADTVTYTARVPSKLRQAWRIDDRFEN